VSLSCFLLVTGSTFLIPPRRGLVIKAYNLPHLPSMDHGKVFGGFCMSIYIYIYIYIGNVLIRLPFDQILCTCKLDFQLMFSS
jgi:hypothetical protein